MSSEGLMPRPNDGFGGSSDWFQPVVSCTCEACHCNDGKGRCAVPSKIQIGPDGCCRTSKHAVDKKEDPWRSL